MIPMPRKYRRSSTGYDVRGDDALRKGVIRSKAFIKNKSTSSLQKNVGRNEFPAEKNPAAFQ